MAWQTEFVCQIRCNLAHPAAALTKTSCSPSSCSSALTLQLHWVQIEILTCQNLDEILRDVVKSEKIQNIYQDLGFSSRFFLNFDMGKSCSAPSEGHLGHLCQMKFTRDHLPHPARRHLRDAGMISPVHREIFVLTPNILWNT